MNRQKALMLLLDLSSGPSSHKKADEILISLLETEGFAEIVKEYKRIPRHFGRSEAEISKPEGDPLKVILVAINMLPDYDDPGWESEPDNMKCDIDAVKKFLVRALDT